MVLEADGAPAVLCLGIVLDSLPPQCDGLELTGWDWDSVDGEESSGGATWGYYELTGHLDGKNFDVVSAGPPPPYEGENETIETACDEPAGGWERPDPSKMSETDRARAVREARREPDFAGAWVDQIGPSDPGTDNAEMILDLAFTGDLDRHERDARRHWGGALCISSHEIAYDRLMRIQNELIGAVGKELGLEVLTAGSSENRNVVEISVVTIDVATMSEIERRYGPGTVEVVAQLEPVS